MRKSLLTLIVAGALLMCGACKKKPTGDAGREKSEMKPAPMADVGKGEMRPGSMARVAAPPRPTAMPPAARPAAPQSTMLFYGMRTDIGAHSNIMVGLPGKAWDCRESHSSRPRKSHVICRPLASGKRFLMKVQMRGLSAANAKLAVDQLVKRDLRKSYAWMVKEPKEEKQGPVTLAGRKGYSLEVSGKYRGTYAMRRVDQVIKLGNMMLVATAWGEAQRFKRLRPVVLKWFASLEIVKRK